MRGFICPPSPVATDDKDDGSRGTEQERRKEKKGKGKKEKRNVVSFSLASTVPVAISRAKAYRAALPFLRVLFISLPCVPFISLPCVLSPCPHGSLYLVLYGAENYGAVDSVFSLAVPDRRNFRRRVIRG